MVRIEDLVKRMEFLSGGKSDVQKIQKLCYYCQAWYFTLYDTPLVSEMFEAREKGPSCTAIYEAYTEDQCNVFNLENPIDDEFTNMIFIIYGNLSGEQLSTLTHNEPPWINARITVKSDSENKSPEITLHSMREYYKNQALYGMLSSELKKGLLYKKIILADNYLFYDDVDEEEKSAINDAIKSKGFMDNIAYPLEIKEKKYEFFKNDDNIIILTDESVEYAMEFARKNAVSEVAELIEKEKLTYCWQTGNDGKKDFVSYTSPELGLMVCTETAKDAIISAIEMLSYIAQHYKENECKPQDQTERDIVSKVYSLYVLDEKKFRDLLGLDESHISCEGII